jgi:RHH-type proline utilization regulon transcriptional repressor/proline dehydrogenase/delta 1-pyrroline-5-carboxylate dehydrogenase
VVSDPLQLEIETVARELASAGEGKQVGAFHLGWWSEQMLEWAFTHPEFKTQLFRFVDVFPRCRDAGDVLQHMSEYFDGVPVPRAVGLGLDVAEQVPLGGVASAAVARRSIRRMARQFIVGADPRRAVAGLRRLWEQGEANTVDLLGERVVSDGEADHYAHRVLELLELLVAETRSWPTRDQLERDPWGDLPRADVSVKPTALTPLFSPLTGSEALDAAMARIRPVLDRARGDAAAVHLDTEHDEAKDLGYELLRRMGSEYPDVQLGCVVQAYRRDSYADLRDLVAWSADQLQVPLRVRLVKGAYWDQEEIVAGATGWPLPVFARKPETDANFERCTKYLIEHAGEVRPAIASHNLRSVAHAIVVARTCELGEGVLELQLLYGMAEPVHTALVRAGHRVRVYTPVGELVPGIAYLVRRLLENTSNESFVRNRFAEGRDLDELIRPPAVDRDRLPNAPTAPIRLPTDPESPTPFTNEPHAELRREPARAGLVRAVSDAVGGLGFVVPALVGGRTAMTEREIVSVDPGRIDRVVCHSGGADAAVADMALDIATAAWPAWRATSPEERAAVLFRAAAILRARRMELAALEVFEAGKPIAEADADVCEAIDFCEYYGREALRIAAGGRVGQAPGEANAYSYEPRGIGVVISPWNFPLAIPTGMVTAALVTGNAVLFKPAEQTPGIALRLVEILYEAGVPAGVLAFLPGVGEEVGAYLVEHPSVAFVVFTGSKAVGLHIIERAAIVQPGQRQVKRVIAEMGGKNPVVVDTDADLDVVVPAITNSAFAYAGQKCSAASRVIASGAVFDELAERLAGATAIVPVGQASELRTVCGPLIDAEAHDRVQRYRSLAHEEGDVLIERNDVPDGGWFVGPSIVVTRDPRSRVATDEIFGPLLTMVRADDFDHALALANDTDYALTAGLFSRSPSRIAEATRRLRAGNVYVNRGVTGALVGRQPFGGFGLSGVGSKAGGPDYLLQFVEPRVVTENTARQGFAPPSTDQG